MKNDLFNSEEFERHLVRWRDDIANNRLPIVDLSDYQDISIAGMALLLTFAFATAEGHYAPFRDALPLLLPRHEGARQQLYRMRFLRLAAGVDSEAFVNASVVSREESPFVRSQKRFRDSGTYPFMPFVRVVERGSTLDSFEVSCTHFIAELTKTFDAALVRRLGFSQVDRDRFWEPNKEIVENIHYHSRSWGFGAIHSSSTGVTFSYSDLGIGMAATLAPTHPQLQTYAKTPRADAQAVRLAFRPGISGTPGNSRGLGLSITRDVIRSAGGTLQCRSGSARITFLPSGSFRTEVVQWMPGVQLTMHLPVRKDH